ncbi:MAG: 16S rRNA (cytosine(1402)-N(4))-methyltransferase RsmH [Planctomycetota bacterium]|nr:MAG: 16S rRNA (cytosine(1402)-N(4))-methyltransferase RsmH [Planctomycetota bacterium]
MQNKDPSSLPFPLHTPVMPQQVYRCLFPEGKKNFPLWFWDLTVGMGGHTRFILERCPNVRVLALDCDEEALERAKENLKDFAPRIDFYLGNFRHLWQLKSLPSPEAILMDLGVSSYQLENPQRGFSFQKAGPLDMRMDLSSPITLKDFLKNLDQKELANILWEYGQERYSRPIAKAILRARHRIQDTLQLAEIVSKAVKVPPRRIHPATRTFQALRIALNDELGALEEGLRAAFALLKKGGRMAILSFHSLEDRLVKRFFQKLSQEKKGRLLWKKPQRPTPEEVAQNPRSRSAKLRCLEKESEEALSAL